MSEGQEAAESLLGRMWLGCAAAVTLLAPIWLMLSAIIIQLSPELSGFDTVLDGSGEVRRVPALRAWIFGGGLGAVLIAVAIPLLGLMLGLLRGIGAWARRRDEVERLRYDALVADDAVLDDADWAAPEDETARGA